MKESLLATEAVPVVADASVSGSGFSGWSDWIGMIASIGCAIHCAAMPFVIAYLPSLGLSFLSDESFHKWMALACFGIALTAFIPGIRKHRRFAPMMIGGVGLLMISTAAFGFAGECCPACEVDDPINQVALNLDGSEGSGGVSDGCTDACCPVCDAEDSACAAETPADSDSDGQVAVLDEAESSDVWSTLSNRIAPWLTPLGGIVLVGAHLLNRRFGCLCGCCETVAQPQSS